MEWKCKNIIKEKECGNMIVPNVNNTLLVGGRQIKLVNGVKVKCKRCGEWTKYRVESSEKISNNIEYGLQIN